MKVVSTTVEVLSLMKVVSATVEVLGLMKVVNTTVEVLGLMKVVSATVLPSKNNVETAENDHILHQCADQALSQTQQLHSINRANNNLAHTTSVSLT